MKNLLISLLTLTTLLQIPGLWPGLEGMSILGRTVAAASMFLVIAAAVYGVDDFVTEHRQKNRRTRSSRQRQQRKAA